MRASSCRCESGSKRLFPIHAKGRLWNDEGEPTIDHPSTSRSSMKIKERTEATRRSPVGDPWETRLPTTAVLVRKGSHTARMERVSPTEWNWKPKV